MNRRRLWLHPFSSEFLISTRVLKTTLISGLICLFGNAVEFSTSPKSKTSCDFLKTWLSQDVSYIIPDTERAWAQEAPKSDDCDFPVQRFWAPRDPTPDTINNEFKEEFYDRILYANAHFGTGDRIGWKTDRGRVYIAWGPPDRVESGKGEYSIEIWHYLNKEKHYGLEGAIEFEDPSGKGNHRILMNASAQRALSQIPNTRSDVKELPNGYIILCGRPPQTQFKGLQTILNVGVSYSLLPFTCRTEYIPVTESTVLASITVKIPKTNVGYQNRKETRAETTHIFGIVRRDRKVLEIFEGTPSVMSPDGLRESAPVDSLLFKKVVPLFPGTYGLELAIEDTTTGNLGTLYRTITVPSASRMP